MMATKETAAVIVDRYFDTESIVDVTAINSVMGVTDDWRQRHNFYWYVRKWCGSDGKKRKKLVMIPWDYDRINDDHRARPWASTWYEQWPEGDARCRAPETAEKRALNDLKAQKRPVSELWYGRLRLSRLFVFLCLYVFLSEKESITLVIPSDLPFSLIIPNGFLPNRFFLAIHEEMPDDILVPVQCDPLTKVFSWALADRVRKRAREFAKVGNTKYFEEKMAQYTEQIYDEVLSTSFFAINHLEHHHFRP